MSRSAGAYGLRLPDLPGQQWLGEVPRVWPRWTIAQDEAPLRDEPEWVTADAALLRMRPVGQVAIDRVSATSVIRGLPSPPDAAFVHPILGSTAIMAAEWNGRLAFHGGCVLDPQGRAWGILGEREAGKSTALAWFHLHGWSVFADDLIVTDGAEVFSGPRCLDLRGASATQFGLGEDLGVIGTRRRWRVDLPATVPSAPLAGVVVLDWAPEPTVRQIPVTHKASELQHHRALKVAQQHGLAWLDLLGRPTWWFRRPRSWSAMDGAMAILRDAMSSSEQGRPHQSTT